MNSDLFQLELKLGMPWNGYSPRSLTRIAKILTFQAGTGRSNLGTFEAIDVDQIELFPEGTPYGS